MTLTNFRALLHVKILMCIVSLNLLGHMLAASSLALQPTNMSFDCQQHLSWCVLAHVP